MGAGENVHLGIGEGLCAPVVLARVIQACDVKAPASQRFGVTVHYADPSVADAVARHHRQLLEARKQIGMT